MVVIMKKLSFMLSICILMSSAVNAEKIYFNDGKIDYSISMDSQDGEAVLNVMNGGFAFDDNAWSEGDASNIVYSGSTVPNEDKTVNFKFILPNAGKYNAELYYKDKQQTESIIYIVKDEFENTIKALNNAKNDENTIADILTGKRAELGLWIDLYDLQDKGDVAKILKSTLQKAELSETDYEESQRIIAKCFVTDALNKGTITSLNEYKQVLGLTDKVKNDFWISEHSGEIAERISKKGYSDCNVIDDDLNEAVAMVKIKYADGFGEVKDVVSYFKNEIGISEISDTTARKVMGNSYSDFKSLANALNHDVGDSSSKNESSPSSRNGGFSGKSSSVVTIEYDTASEKNIQSSTNRFTDLDGYSWVSNEIEELAKKGIINGRTYNTFCPAELITREEFVTLIVNTFNIQVKGDDPGFSDVTEDSWYYKSVTRAYNSGIIKGISENQFGSGKNIMRQDLAVIVYNVLKLCNVEFEKAEDNTDFSDNAEISDYAKEAVWELKDKGIMVGSDNMFNPKSNTTRAEAAKVIYSLLDYSEGGVGE